MKKVMIVLFLGIISAIISGCGSNENKNRYGSMVLYEDELYYYNNGSVYKYNDGISTQIEKADSMFFTVNNDNGTPVIEYKDEGDEVKETPYDTMLKGATYIACNDSYVYARYPGKSVTIAVYSVVRSEGSADTLKIIDDIKLS